MTNFIISIVQDAFKMIMKKFFDIYRTKYPSIDALLFGDHMACHLDIDSIKEGLKQAFFLWFLPPNCTHFMQPLDEQPFGNLKKKIYSEGERYLWDDIMAGEDTKTTFLQAAMDAEESALSADVIRKSFINCGLWPFNVERIMYLAEQNLAGTTSSFQKPIVEEYAREAAAAVIQTALAKTKKRKRETTRGIIKVDPNKIYDGRELVRKKEEEQAEIEKVENDKLEKKRQRREQSDKRIQEKQAKKDLRKSNICNYPECRKENRGATNWMRCLKCCKIILCPKHKIEIDAKKIEEQHACKL